MKCAASLSEPRKVRSNEQDDRFGAASDESAPTRAAAFAKFKWQWLDQVSSDHTIPSAGFKLAYVLASGYLNAQTRDCFPSQITLAERLGVKERQVRNLIDTLKIAGHLRAAQGGRGKANKYRPVLLDRQNIAGQNSDLTGSDEHLDRQSTNHMTGKELPPNPLKEPFEEPRQTPEASAVGKYSVIDRDARLTGASKNQSYHISTGQKIRIGEHGNCLIGNIGSDDEGRFHLYFHVEMEGDRVAPYYDDGTVDDLSGWWVENEPGKTQSIRWEVEND